MAGMGISVKSLTKSFGALTAVDDVSFEVGTGEFFGILGPNGAGKTTTLEIIEGLQRPDAGEVRIGGLASWPRNRQLLPRIGVQLQASAFFESLSSREQLSTFAALYGTPRTRVEQMLELVGLTDKADTRTDKLSGGQRQRLSIACALVHDPDVVFLDEPTSGLDPQSRRQLWDLLSRLNESGRTVMLTTHFMEEAEELCDRVAIMDHGQILRLDAPAALVRALHAPVRISVDPTVIDIETARTLPGTEQVTNEAAAVVITTHDAATVLAELASHHALEGLSVHGASLEDVFLELTGREYRG